MGMASLNIDILGMKFSNPIFTAAGPGAKDGKLCVKAVQGGAGGIVTKTISENPADVPRPCMAKTNSGFLNTELWSELPKEQWAAKEYKRAKEAGVPMIVSMGYTADQISKVAPLVKPYADAVELSTHYVGTYIGPIVNAMKAAKAKPVNIATASLSLPFSCLTRRTSPQNSARTFIINSFVIFLSIF